MDSQTTLTFMCFVISIILSLILYGDLKNPLGIFTFSFLGLLLLSTSNFVNYSEVSNLGLWILLANCFAYLLGNLFIYIMPKKNSGVNKNTREKKQEGNYWVIKGLNISIVLSLIGGLGWIIFSSLSNNIFLIFNSENIYSQRATILDSVPSIFSYLVYTFSLGGAVLIGILVSETKKFEKRYALIFFSPLVLSMILGQRAFLIITLLSMVAPFLLNFDRFTNKKSVSNNYVFKVFMMLTLFYIFVGTIRGSFNSEFNNDFALSNMFNKTYIYLTGSFRAFSIGYEQWDGVLQYGINTFTPFIKLLNLLNISSFDQNLITVIENGRDPVMIPNLFNIYTYVWDFINDFGFIGSLFMSFTLGAVFNYFWYKAKSKSAYSYYRVIAVYFSVFIMYGFVSSLTSFSIIWYGYSFAFAVLFYNHLKNTTVKGERNVLNRNSKLER